MHLRVCFPTMNFCSRLCIFYTHPSNWQCLWPSMDNAFLVSVYRRPATKSGFCAGLTRVSEDLTMMLGKRPNVYFRVCWTVFAPVTIVVSFSLQTSHRSCDRFRERLLSSRSDVVTKLTRWMLLESVPCFAI